MRPSNPVPLRLLAAGTAAALGLLGSPAALAQPGPAADSDLTTGPGAGGQSAPTVQTAPAAEAATEISEISYAGPDDTDFIEIAAEPGTDLSGWTVGTISRGGSPQSDEHMTTLPEGTAAGEAGVVVVELPITNSVKEGSRADGAYGSSAFVIDAAGAVVDFDQVGGVLGGRGITAASADSVPEALRGLAATPTGAVAAAGSSLHFDGASWAAAEPTPGIRGDHPAEPERPEPPVTGQAVSIAEIQGSGDVSPLLEQSVTTEGVVTAAYPEGGLRGYYVQTAGSGGPGDTTPGASDGIFLYSPDTVALVVPGDHVRVTGTVAEYYGQTQLSVASGALELLTDPAEEVLPVTDELPTDPSEREALEGMLLQPSGDITVTDNYSTGRYGEIGLTNGTEPLKQATDVVTPGAEAQAYEAANAAQKFLLDDGATVDYSRSAADIPVPYLSAENPVRVGAPVVFEQPVVLGYGFDAWRLQPTGWVTGTSELGSPARFGDTRTSAPLPVGGKVSIASFNVLNYFTTTGDQLPGCEFYTDREGRPITVRGGCTVRGAADAKNLARQQEKIVSAINTMDTSVLSLEEVENSAAVGKNRDDALAALVSALNSAAGYEKWAYVPSPEKLPAEEDVIRTAFIYQPEQVRPVGDSVILTGSPVFGNAREPLAQAFAPSAAPDSAGEVPAPEAEQTFLAVVNHFKSKGSGSGEGNEDSGDGQGSSNADRVRQAEALRDFAATQAEAAGVENILLLGDFNSYTQEDPMRVLYDADYTDIGSTKGAGETYLYGGRVGSLDHVLANGPMFEHVTGAEVWNINSVESVNMEYSRYNANAKNLYAPGPYRSSDHDPLVVGLNWPKGDGEEPGEPGQPGDPDEPGNPGQPEDPGKSAEPGAPGQPGDAGHPTRPGAPEASGAPDQQGGSDQSGQTANAGAQDTAGAGNQQQGSGQGEFRLAHTGVAVMSVLVAAVVLVALGWALRHRASRARL